MSDGFKMLFYMVRHDPALAVGLGLIGVAARLVEDMLLPKGDRAL